MFAVVIFVSTSHYFWTTMEIGAFVCREKINVEKWDELAFICERPYCGNGSFLANSFWWKKIGGALYAMCFIIYKHIEIIDLRLLKFLTVYIFYSTCTWLFVSETNLRVVLIFFVPVLQVMTCRPRSDLFINLPALCKLDNMLLVI